MEKYSNPTTYEEARIIGVYRDWYGVLLTVLEDKTRYIAINLLKKGFSIENVYEATRLSEEEHQSRNADYWNKICAAVDAEKFEMAKCFQAIIDERISEITEKVQIEKMKSTFRY
jgi:hypothetical protein